MELFSSVRYGGKRFLVASVIAIGRSLRNPWTLSPRGPAWNGVARPSTVHERARSCTNSHERQCLSKTDIRFCPASTISAPRLLFRLNKRARPFILPFSSIDTSLPLLSSLLLTLTVNAIINYRSTQLYLYIYKLRGPTFAPRSIDVFQLFIPVRYRRTRPELVIYTHTHIYIM